MGEVRARPDYLGRSGFRRIERLERQFTAQQHLYWLRKRACFDLIEVFSELHQVEPDVFKARVGLDDDDFADTEIQEVLDVYNEVKHGLEDDEQEDEGEESEEEEEQEEQPEDDEDNSGEEEVVESEEEIIVAGGCSQHNQA